MTKFKHIHRNFTWWTHTASTAPLEPPAGYSEGLFGRANTTLIRAKRVLWVLCVLQCGASSLALVLFYLMKSQLEYMGDLATIMPNLKGFCGSFQSTQCKWETNKSILICNNHSSYLLLSHGLSILHPCSQNLAIYSNLNFRSALFMADCLSSLILHPLHRNKEKEVILVLECLPLHLAF